MEDTITVGELITLLQKFDKDKKAMVCGVGLTSHWEAPMYFGEDTVDEYKGIVRINISAVG